MSNDSDSVDDTNSDQTLTIQFFPFTILQSSGNQANDLSDDTDFVDQGDNDSVSLTF